MSEDPNLLSVPAPRPASRTPFLVLLALLVVLVAGVGFVGYRILERLDTVDRKVADLAARADDARARSREAGELSRQAFDRADNAEAVARTAAEGRLIAESVTADAVEEADAARDEAASAREAAARAEAEAARVRKQAEAEVNRLEQALGQVAETRRTALGVVMNLGSDYLKFEFDKADLRPEDKELLSRIAGILLTSRDYTVAVHGHTDDVGTQEYNQKLSERRAQAVRDYLVEAGLPPEILSVEGHGKTLPLVQGTSDEARAKNRRVELGVVNTRIRYGRSILRSER
ncbi:MAG: OmpA family protein [Acidobacteria bacterium]|jgi:outer membrane protein OmpA-like peptidoglycan-associated protein|nr:OmpA family protein [Acidobacteriota bacterium]